MTSLRDVPMDVIQYVVYPMLDRQSRLLANDIFYPSRVIEKRIATRISSEHRIAHAIIIETSMLLPHLYNIKRQINHDTKNAIMSYVIILFRKILHGAADMCIQYNNNFRTTLINRCINYTNPLNREYIHFTTGYKKGLIRLCERIIERLDTLPFVRNVRSQNVY
jgi:hypothetical protein